MSGTVDRVVFVSLGINIALLVARLTLASCRLLSLSKVAQPLNEASARTFGFYCLYNAFHFRE